MRNSGFFRARGSRVCAASIAVATVSVFLASLIGGCSRPLYEPAIDPFRDCAVNNDDLKARLLLVGDAGYPEIPVLDLLTEWAGRDPGKTTVVFLGDNVYPNGITVRDSARTSERLRRQINVIIKSKSRGIFIPGNHDWGSDGAAASIEREANLVKTLLPDSSFLPRGGCPGPVVIEGDPMLVILDTQWWFLKRRDACGGTAISPRDVVDSLTKVMKSASTNTILLAHHPLISYGNHGGSYDWRDIAFPLTRIHKVLWIPLPLIGIAYPLVRKYILHPAQDLTSETYTGMRDAIAAALSAYNGLPPLVYAAGHDHSLQVIHRGNERTWFLVSGAGSRSMLTPVRLGCGSLFAHKRDGFMILDYYGDHSILLRVAEPGKAAPVFCRMIR